ncbi:unnamed protein product [Lepeophtheirus salmonis]|uniref:(salmon louse) hypothetical protein n=1 Tax=Lepeophtheirus salmonis TaxID=72036 RepID=A0A7R8HBZ9_LEPSM|nr:unnamed protein product [Lepeophtheirus salmonis]CAF2992561.1 unnamed protein product [Lepeophtheirus salmonis]
MSADKKFKTEDESRVFNKEWTVKYNFTDTWCGTVQLEEDEERPVVFASRKLSQAEKNYSQIDRKATTIIFSHSKFERYLLGRPFTIITDHKPWEYILSPNRELPQVVTARLARFAVKLSMFKLQNQTR